MMLCRHRFCALFLLLATAAPLGAFQIIFCTADKSFAASADNEPLRWPDEWVIFVPLSKANPVLDVSLLRAVPDTLEIPGFGHQPPLVLEGRRVPARAGQPVDLTDLVAGTPASSVAYVFVELIAPSARRTTLGLGCDWLMQGWVNGREILNTIATGEEDHPSGILNHQIEVDLCAGANVLAIRLLRGRSALLALGDESHFGAEQARLDALRELRGLNVRPETLAERLVLPVNEQATATAGWRIDLDLPEADPAAGALLGLRPMPERQLYLRGLGRRAEMRDTLERRFDEPVTILLSKRRYPFEDRHLDAIIWTTPLEGERLVGTLEVRLLDSTGAVLARHEIERLSPTGWFLSVGFPPLLAGRDASLEVVWHNGGREIGRAQSDFQVSPPANVATAGRVPLRVLNGPGAFLAGAPMTVGVPFPRGALLDADAVRLVDETGAEVPLQARVTSRWSRFGPVKWLLCDFTADLAGEPREFFLEYGRGVSRTPRPPLAEAGPATGFPALDAGRLRVTQAGLEFDPVGDGSFVPVLGPGALAGEFVRHEDDRRYIVPADTVHEFEELGGEKAVVRRTGWYREAGTGERFCQFVTRLVFHRDSPVVRVFHTWIFTGDGNRDRIRNMGWRFEAAGELKPGGFLASFETGEWISGAHLVQHDHEHYDLAGADADAPGRTPGVLAASVGGTRVYFGAKDFWQNFPSELAFDGAGFTFYNWPAHNPPARFARPVAPADAFRHRFAHEGRVLDFRLPEEYSTGEIWQQACSRELHWAEGEPETANAQGISRTEELFLYFADPEVTPEAAAAVMLGLNDESLRAVADPAWVAASGAFGIIHHRDPENYPEDEHLYEQVVHAPARWNERLGFYGMWLHGDVPAWDINLDARTVSLYRALRKNHHGWPLGWLPYARSGDPRLLKYAEAATRQMSDANFCHYADEAVDAVVGPEYYRSQGRWDRSLLPWASRQGPGVRGYTVDCDFLWHAYYLTGYARARDVALLFGTLTRHNHVAPRAGRSTLSMQSSYLDMYQTTWEPWFLDAAHVIGSIHLAWWDDDVITERLPHDAPGHFWRPALENFYRFTGDEDHRRLALNHSIGYSSPRAYAFGGLWPRLSVPYIRQAVFAWEQTGDDWFLRRAGAYLDWARRGVYDGELEYARGSIVHGGTARGIFTGYYISQFPFALGAFERAGQRPLPHPNPFFVNGTRVSDPDDDVYHFRLPETVIRKRGERAVSISLAPEQRDNSQTYYHQITSPDGQVFDAGAWPLDFRPRTVEISADAPDGDYRLVIGGRVPLVGSSAARARIMRLHGGVLMPVTEPGGAEVMVFERTEEGTRVAAGGPEIQYWFRVPEGIDEFWIDFRLGTGGDFNRVSVWNPERERAWDRSFSGEAPGRVMISVPPEQAGRIWGASGGMFVIDPRIPPYFSASPARWFNPEE